MRFAEITKENVKPEVLAIIPARGGSKGIPRKNLQMLGSKPLVAWAVETALAERGISRVVVSTDDPEIASVARDYGAEVPFLRGDGISGDRAEIAQALSHVREGLFKREGYAPTHQLVLYPTHPFRRASTLSAVVDTLCSGYQTVNTVKRMDFANERYFYEREGRLLPYGDNRLVPYVRTYGYAAGRALRFSANGHYQYVLTDDVELIDIDTWADLELAREVVNHNLFDSAS
jgi:CMP-N-acetylneuraminic acid synthetase